MEKRHKEISDDLWILQTYENEGNGIQVIRHICNLLSHGQIKEAQDVAINEWDKIRRYPKISAYITEHLISEYAHEFKEKWGFWV